MSINIVDTGADSDSADNTAAIMSAHDALPDAGGVIYVPPSDKPYLSGRLNFTKPIILKGASSGLSQIKAVPGNNDDLIFAQDVDGIEFHNIQLDADRDNQTLAGVTGNAVRLRRCHKIKFSGCRFLNGHNGTRHEGGSDISYESCYATNAEVNGFYCIKSSDDVQVSGLRFVDCLAELNVQDGFSVDGGSHDVIMSGSISRNNGGGFVAVMDENDQLAGRVSKVTITGCVSSGNGLSGIALTGVTQATVSGNISMNDGFASPTVSNGSGIYIKNNLPNMARIQDVTVSGNIIAGSQWHGIHVEDTLTGFTVYGCVISGNVVKNPSSHGVGSGDGIYLNGTIGVSITGNRIVDARAIKQMGHAISIGPGSFNTQINPNDLNSGSVGLINDQSATTRYLTMDENGDVLMSGQIIQV